MARPRAADDFETIRARLEELRLERDRALTGRIRRLGLRLSYWFVVAATIMVAAPFTLVSSAERLAVQNLLDDRHPEFGAGYYTSASEFPRTVYAQFSWQF